MPYHSTKHGRAEYNRFMQLTSGAYLNIRSEEGGDEVPLVDQRYAQLVYQVNSTTISGNVGIDGVTITSGALNVYDENVLNEISAINSKIDPQVQSLIRYDGDYTYIMNSLPGTATSGETSWRIKRVYDGTETTIMYAEGSDAFDKAASGYLSYNYTFKV